VSWRVLTWNILGARDPDLAAIAARIDERDVDVVAVQEVRSGQARRLGRHLGMRVQWARKHYPYTPLLWWRAEGLALLSPHPFGDVERFSLTPDLSTWTYRHRVALAATVRRGAETLRVYDVHLSTGDADRRIAQGLHLAGRIRADAPYVPTVLAGDLNVGDDVIEVMRAFSEVGGLVDPGGDDTNPAVQPVRRLDYVLVPAGATVDAVDTPEGGQEWHELSDHLPVTVTFTVPNDEL
jgi:endonuclease/exonuclease/phosphatase family metal-dependent hydrolase